MDHNRPVVLEMRRNNTRLAGVSLAEISPKAFELALKCRTRADKIVYKIKKFEACVLVTQGISQFFEQLLPLPLGDLGCQENLFVADDSSSGAAEYIDPGS